MSQGLNKVMIIGWVDGDFEMRHTPSGRPVTSFSVATSRTWTSAEGDSHEETEWFNVVAWGKTAEIVENYLTKGNEVAVEGKLTHRSYENKEGEKRYITEIRCNELLMLGKA